MPPTRTCLITRLKLFSSEVILQNLMKFRDSSVLNVTTKKTIITLFNWLIYLLPLFNVCFRSLCIIRTSTNVTDEQQIKILLQCSELRSFEREGKSFDVPQVLDTGFCLLGYLFYFNPGSMIIIKLIYINIFWNFQNYWRMWETSQYWSRSLHFV